MKPGNPRLDTVASPAARILIFTRLASHGRVKTRFARDTDAELAIRLHQAMSADILENLRPMSDGDPLAEVLWASDAEPDENELAGSFGDFRTERQEGIDLGERMMTAFTERFYLRRATKILAIGTDLPTLRAHDLEVALSLLDSCDWVIGPSSDGGYYAIGCQASAWRTSTFEAIQWGSPTVCESTIARIRSTGGTIALLPERTDIDHLEDLMNFDDDELKSHAPRTWKTREEIEARV